MTLRSTRTWALLATAALGLSACAGGSIVNKDAPKITIDDVLLGTVSEAYDVADAHCASYDSRAQMLDDDKADGTITFACVN